MGKCIIMCAGEFVPVSPAVQEGDLVIAADNGLVYLDRLGTAPDLVIGDFDSLNAEGRVLLSQAQENSGAVIVLPREKDDTDTLAAVKEGFRRGFTTFYLYCALGGRVDHTMANIQTLIYIREHGGKGYIMDRNQMLFVIRNESRTFHRGFGGTFSLFAMDTVVRDVTIRGMKYPLEHADITNSFPIGISNEIRPETEASVTVGDGTALVCVSWE